MQFQGATSKSTTDRKVADLIAYTMSVSWNPTDHMAGSTHEQCANNDEGVESFKIHKPPIFLVTVAKTLFSHIMLEQASEKC